MKKNKKNSSKQSTKKISKKPIEVENPAKYKNSVQVGQKVPDFCLPSTAGQEFQLSDYKGKKVLLYFYPKDSTPGCTAEGHDFSDRKALFSKKNVVICGVSRDSMKSHENFKSKQKFSVELLSDSDEVLCKMFAVVQKKNMYGKMVTGIERSTFLIDEDGRLIQEWRKIKAAGHAQEVLNSL